MATELATAYISLVPSARGMKSAITSDLRGAGTEGSAHITSSLTEGGRKAAGNVKSALSTAIRGAAATFAGAAIIGVAGVKSAIDSASNLNEATSKVNAIFGPEGQKLASEWAKNAASAFGQSEEQAISAVGTYGNLFTSFGIGQDQALGMSTNLTQLASDLASFNNTSVDEALQALQSGVTGETEPLKRYGIALDDASLKAKALAMGIGDGKTQLTPAQKAQAAYALIMERSANAQGDFARTSDGLANRQRILAARFENMKAKIGTALLPVALKLAEVFMDRVLPAMQTLADKGSKAFSTISEWWKGDGEDIKTRAQSIFDRVQVVVGNVVAFVRENWPQIKQTVSDVMDSIQRVIGSVVDIVQTVWRNFGDDILNLARKVFPNLLEQWASLWKMISGIFETVAALLRGDWGEMWEAIKRVASGAWEFIQAGMENAVAILGTLMSGLGNLLKTIWSGMWDKLKELAAWALQWVVDEVGKIPGRIATAAVGMFDGIKEAFKSAIGWVVDKWNNTIGSLSWTVPDWVPTIGGNTISGPKLPEFHQGGVVPGPPGSEVPAMLLAGERVLSPAESRDYSRGRRGRGRRPVQVNQHIYSADAGAVNRDLLWEFG